MLAAYYLMKTSKSKSKPGITEYYSNFDDRKHISFHGVSSRCRVCLHEGNSSIYAREDTEELIEALKIFGNIILSENDLTKVLCSTCYEFIKQAMLFRKVAMHSDKLLKNPTKEDTAESYNKSKEIPSECDQSFTTEESFSSEEEFSGSLDNYSHNSYEDETQPEKLKNQDSSAVSEDKKILKREQKEKSDGVRKVRKTKVEKVKTLVKIYKERDEMVKYNSKVTCHICNKVVSSSYYKQHLTMHEPDPNKYICEVCGKSFRLQCAYRNHSLRHRTDFLFKCQLCPYRGRYKELLKMHMRTHTTDHRYMCTECPGRFRFKSNLNTHMQKHKEPQYKCNSCKRAFHTKIMLDRHHEADHLGIKNHVCNICDKAFGYRNAMMKHQRLVHKREKLSYGRMPSYLQEADNTDGPD